MASFFKKLGRLAKKVAKPALRVAAAQLTAGASEAALRVAKGIGAFNPKKPLKNIPSVAIQRMIAKTNDAAAKKYIPQSHVSATAMPGGSPIRAAAKARSHMATARRAAGMATRSAKKKALKQEAAENKARGAAYRAIHQVDRHGRSTKGSGGGRRAPTGGKDLKGLSVSWRAAGKPGRWIDWVKSH